MRIGGAEKWHFLAFWLLGFSKKIVLFFSMQISLAFIWGIIHFCTMDGFFRILEKTSFQLICTRLYISLKCSSRSPILPTILVQSLKVSGTWVMTNTNTKMYVGASNAETRLLHNGVHIFFESHLIIPFYNFSVRMYLIKL